MIVVLEMHDRHQCSSEGVRLARPGCCLFVVATRPQGFEGNTAGPLTTMRNGILFWSHTSVSDGSYVGMRTFESQPTPPRP